MNRRNPVFQQIKIATWLELLSMMQTAGSTYDYRTRKAILVEVRWRMQQSWKAGKAEAGVRAEAEAERLGFL